MQDSIKREFRRFWAASPWLTAVGLASLGLCGVTLVGLAVDERMITGSPAWLKPTKFAISIATYCLTLAWIFAAVAEPSRLLRGAGRVIAAALGIEMVIIAGQAARGTTSHFNVATPLDAGLFAAMGLGILALLGASAVVAVGLARATFADRAWGLALKLGMLVTVVGATTGGFMLRPTPAQAAAQAAGVPQTNGAHTVGALDGGPGLPVVGWSREHGDLRAPHFVGLHAVQAVPILAWLAFLGLKPRSERSRIALVALIALSYSALIVLLMVQALAGRPVLASDPVSLAGFAAWAGLTLAGFVVVLVRERSRAESKSPRLRPGSLNRWTPKPCSRGVAGRRCSAGSS